MNYNKFTPYYPYGRSDGVFIGRFKTFVVVMLGLGVAIGTALTLIVQEFMK